VEIAPLKEAARLPRRHCLYALRLESRPARLTIRFSCCFILRNFLCWSCLRPNPIIRSLTRPRRAKQFIPAETVRPFPFAVLLIQPASRHIVASPVLRFVRQHARLNFSKLHDVRWPCFLIHTFSTCSSFNHLQKKPACSCIKVTIQLLQSGSTMNALIFFPFQTMVLNSARRSQ
jgi:hypothetical protein